MDCRISSEMMMKYFDGEIGVDDEKLLFQHLESCADCSFEFRELKATFSMLEAVEMEDAPDDMEIKVISRIEEAQETDLKSKKILGISFIILASWMGLFCLILYTPFVETILECMNSFFGMISYCLNFAGNALFLLFTSFAKVLVLGRVFDVVMKAVLDNCTITMVVLIPLMAIVIRLYGYMFKIVRR